MDPKMMDKAMTAVMGRMGKAAREGKMKRYVKVEQREGEMPGMPMPMDHSAKEYTAPGDKMGGPTPGHDMAPDMSEEELAELTSGIQR